TSNSTLAPLPAPPPADPALAEHEAMRKYGLEKQAADKAKKAAEDKKKAAAAEHANAVLEGDDPEGIYDDPATSEGRAAKQSPAPPSQPPTIQVQKPPM